MNILVLGWFHHKNAGDDRIQQAWTHFFDGHTLAFMPAGRNLPKALLLDYDLLVVGGGGLFTRNSGLPKRLLTYIKTGIPIWVAGVSAEALEEEEVEQLKKFVDWGGVLQVRDEGSADLLGLPDKQVVPDLSFLIPFEPIQNPKENAKLGWVLRNESVFQNLPWKQVLEKLNLPLQAIPFYFENNSDLEQMKQLADESSIPSEFRPDLAQGIKALITGRFHGLLFAIQWGLPFIAISSRPKVHRFAETHGLSSWVMKESEMEQLPEKYELLEANYSTFLERLSTLRAQLIAEAHAGYQQAWGELQEPINAWKKRRKQKSRWRKIFPLNG